MYWQVALDVMPAAQIVEQVADDERGPLAAAVGQAPPPGAFTAGTPIALVTLNAAEVVRLTLSRSAADVLAYEVITGDVAATVAVTVPKLYGVVGVLAVEGMV
ncbi:hypothetical protein D3C71_1495650 [compost metagenome]